MCRVITNTRSQECLESAGSVPPAGGCLYWPHAQGISCMIRILIVQGSLGKAASWQYMKAIILKKQFGDPSCRQTDLPFNRIWSMARSHLATKKFGNMSNGMISDNFAIYSRLPPFFASARARLPLVKRSVSNCMNLYLNKLWHCA